jgi:HEAT repeat protein
VQEWRLVSEDAATRDSAAKALADKGRRVIPYVRKWLGSDSDALVIEACHVLEKMEGRTWVDALNELENVLSGIPSKKTDAVAGFIHKKEYAFKWEMESPEWIHFKNHECIKRNICLYLLQTNENNVWRRKAAGDLIDIGDHTAVESLINALRKDSNSEVRSCAALALGHIGDSRAVPHLLIALEKDIENRYSAASALGDIGDARAVKPLIRALKWNSKGFIKGAYADALGKIGDIRAVKPIIKLLESDCHSDERSGVVRALGRLGDAAAINPLIETLNKDNNSFVLYDTAMALCMFNDKIVWDSIEAFAKQGNKYASIAIAWQYGGDALAGVETLFTDDNIPEVFLKYIKAHWGDIKALDEFLTNKYFSYNFNLIANILSQMPDNFPAYDVKANYAARKKQARALKKWFKKNKSRIAWDENKRRYFLREVKRE